MPTYEYLCEKCDLGFEEVQSIKEYTGKAFCPACKNQGVRIFSCNIHFVGAKVEDAEYNPGLGKITKSKRHRDELAKQLGAVEVGNEPAEKIHDYFDKSRTEKLKKAYDDV